jgi:hypothetical protein
MVASKETMLHFSGDFLVPSAFKLSAVVTMAWQMSGS